MVFSTGCAEKISSPRRKTKGFSVKKTLIALQFANRKCKTHFGNQAGK
jgi:hypothetical protein